MKIRAIIPLADWQLLYVRATENPAFKASSGCQWWAVKADRSAAAQTWTGLTGFFTNFLFVVSSFTGSLASAVSSLCYSCSPISSLFFFFFFLHPLALLIIKTNGLTSLMQPQQDIALFSIETSIFLHTVILISCPWNWPRTDKYHTFHQSTRKALRANCLNRSVYVSVIMFAWSVRSQEGPADHRLSAGLCSVRLTKADRV